MSRDDKPFIPFTRTRRHLCGSVALDVISQRGEAEAAAANTQRTQRSIVFLPVLSRARAPFGRGKYIFYGFSFVFGTLSSPNYASVDTVCVSVCVFVCVCARTFRKLPKRCCRHRRAACWTFLPACESRTPFHRVFCFVSIYWALPSPFDSFKRAHNTLEHSLKEQNVHKVYAPQHHEPRGRRESKKKRARAMKNKRLAHFLFWYRRRRRQRRLDAWSFVAR